MDGDFICFVIGVFTGETDLAGDLVSASFFGDYSALGDVAVRGFASAFACLLARGSGFVVGRAGSFETDLEGDEAFLTGDLEGLAASAFLACSFFCDLLRSF